MTAIKEKAKDEKLSFAAAMEIVSKHSGKSQPQFICFREIIAIQRPKVAEDASRNPGPEGAILVVRTQGHQTQVRVGFRMFFRPVENQTLQDVIDINAAIECGYLCDKADGLSANDQEVLCRVSGVYHSWPYFREFVQSTMSRMGATAPIIPVLSLPLAVRMAGFRDP